MPYRLFITCLLALFLADSTTAQTTTFNKRILIGCINNTVFSGLEVTDSCYYLSGNARDTNNCAFGTLFAKFDTLGNNIHYSITPNYESWFPFLVATDNGLAVAPYFFDSLGMHAAIFEYNTNGQLIWSTQFESPYGFGYYIRPDDLKYNSDSGFYSLGPVGKPNYASNIGLAKFDANGNILWHITRGDSLLREGEGVIWIDEKDNNPVIGFMQDNITPTSSNFTINCQIEKIDSAGNTIWAWQSPFNKQVYGANDLIKTKDGGWVVASALGYEYYHGVYPTAHSDAYLFKLDSARNLLWERSFPSIFDFAHFYKVIELKDSSLVAFGSVNRQHPQPNPTHYIKHGRIVKVSPQGDSLWNREYEYMTTPSAINEIYDAAQTPDGGFLICGQSIGSGAGGSQQGWLLKLDEHGCLVPGCHLVTGVLPPQATETVRLSLYPNPTTDYLNIYYRAAQTGTTLSFRILDAQGRQVLQRQSADVSDKTYIIPTYDLPAALYFLEVHRDGQLLQSEQFVKQ